MTGIHDVAGPAGLSTAYELKGIGFDPLVLGESSGGGGCFAQSL